MRKTIRWGIIGCGAVCEVKSGPGFRKATDSALVAVMRRDRGAAADFAYRHGVANFYDDASKLLANTLVDAVYIATPPSSHLRYTLMAAAAGKAVYVEKPMAMNAEECRAMIDACTAARVPLFVAFYRRALPRFVEIKQRLDSGAIGKVLCATISLSMPPAPATDSWRSDPLENGGGRFFDLACHQLDLLDFLFGPVVSTHAHARSAELITASFAFASGVQASGAWCFDAGIVTDTIEIVGTQGVLAFSMFDCTPPVLLETVDAVEDIQVMPEAHVQQPLIQTIVDELNGDGKCPSTGHSALRTARVMDEILRELRVVSSSVVEA